jgi:HEAT repeat protein
VANPLPAASPAPGPSAEAPQTPVEPLLTAHRLIEACPGHAKGLEFLHVDLFDSRLPVALSALAAVRERADARSFPYVARLIGSANEDIQCAAVRALGSIKHPEAQKLLREILKTSRSDKLRRELFAALCEAAPQDKEIAGVIRHAARSPLGSAAARAHAVGLLLCIGGELALEELLADAREETLDQVLASAAENAALAPRTVTHCATLYARLPARGRASLVTLATQQSLPESSGLLCESIADPHAEVRRAAYAALGTAPHHVDWASAIIARCR